MSAFSKVAAGITAGSTSAHAIDHGLPPPQDRMRVQNFILLMVAAFIAAWIFIPAESQAFDFGCFKSWAIFIHKTGLGHAYELPGVGYNPLFLELLWLFGRMQGSAESLEASFFTFKVFVLLFDFGAVCLAAHLLRRNGRDITLALLLLLNPALLYNTAVWGQVDSLFSACIAFSIFFATRKRVVASLLCVELAMNFKLVAVVFVPLVVLLNLPAVLADRRVLLRALPLMCATQLLILLPFLTRPRLQAIVAANKEQLQVSLSVTSSSGFNLWYIIFGEQTYAVQASQTFLHVSYRWWGVVMFAVAAAAILVPLFKRTVLRKTPLDDAHVFLVSALYGLAFYSFTTGMHERYSHPAVWLLAIYAVLSGSYAMYVLASIAYFLNLEQGMKFFHLASHESLVFKGSFVGGLFLVVLIAGIVKIHWELKTATRLSRSAVSG